MGRLCLAGTAALLAVAWTSPAPAAEGLTGLPAGVTCALISQRYAEWSFVGKPAIRAWLRLRGGYSRAQVAEAERCLKGKA